MSEPRNYEVPTNDFLETLKAEVTRLTLETLFLKTVIRDKDREIAELSGEEENTDAPEGETS